MTPRTPAIRNFVGRKTADATEELCPDGFFVDQEQAILRNLRNELCPDVLLLRDDGASRSPVGRPADVLLVVEVISKSSWTKGNHDKLRWYAEMRIPIYWIIDPLSERVTLAEFQLGPDGCSLGRAWWCSTPRKASRRGGPWVKSAHRRLASFGASWH